MDFWRQENTTAHVKRHYTDRIRKDLPSDSFAGDVGIGFPLYRMTGTYANYELLVTEGLPGLRRMVAARQETAGEAEAPFLEGLQMMLTLLREARAQGISTAVETCGACSEALLAQVAELTDVFLFDFKETDPQLHKRWTGQDNRRILANLDWLQSHGARVILRCPLIPGCNLRQDHLEGILSLLARYPGLEGCELMAYHKLGIAKYKELGLNYALDAQEISPEQKDALLTWMNARAPLTIRWG